MSGIVGPDGWDLVMPFVACASQGGAFADRPFVAGYQCGRIDAALAGDPPPSTVTAVVYAALVPQVDLIAMRYGYRLIQVGVPLSLTREERADEWMTVRLHKIGPGAEPGAPLACRP